MNPPAQGVEKKGESRKKDESVMWYWVLYKGECICSGACDPYDEDIFDEAFNEDCEGESNAK